MGLTYKSTRNSQETVTASLAILKGLANGGGLLYLIQFLHLIRAWMSWQAWITGRLHTML